MKGAVSSNYQGKGWNGNNAAEGGQSSFVKVFQADTSAGGPIIKDKVFFFGSFRYADREVGLSRTPAQLQGPTADRGSRRSTTAATADATTPKLRRSCRQTTRFTDSTSATSTRSWRHSRPIPNPSA